MIASAAVGAVPAGSSRTAPAGSSCAPGDERELAAAIAAAARRRPVSASAWARVGRAAVEPLTYEAAADAFGEALAVADVRTLAA